MLEITAVLSGLIANGLTKLVKSREVEKLNMTEEELDARKTWLRVFNLAMGIVALVVTSYLMGTPIDVTELSSLFEGLVTILLTFGFSQGAYFLASK